MKLCALLLFAALHAPAAEPIAGNWLLKTQQIAGQETPPSRPLILRVVSSGAQLEFQYCVLVNQKQEISLRFITRLDGSAAEVKNFAGAKIGTANVTRSGAAAYLVTLQGPNRPTSSGKMTISKNGKTLLSESDAALPGGAKTHTVQVFERQ
jgi:hypothetical protein